MILPALVEVAMAMRRSIAQRATGQPRGTPRVFAAQTKAADHRAEILSWPTVRVDVGQVVDPEADGFGGFEPLYDLDTYGP